MSRRSSLPLLALFAWNLVPCEPAFGRDVARQAIQDVPLAVTALDLEDFRAADAQMLPYLPLREPLSPEALAALKNTRRFSALSDAAIEAGVVNVRGNAARSVSLIELEAVELSDSLETNLRANGISMGFAPRGYGASADVLVDGARQQHVEPINLYHFSTEREATWDPDLFPMTRDLAIGSYYAGSEVLGFKEADPFDVSLSRHAAGFSASQVELLGVGRMQTVIDSIRADGSWAPSTDEMSAEIGASLTARFAGDPGGLGLVLDQWDGTLGGMRVTAEQRAGHHQAHLRYAELALAADPAVPDLRLGLDRQFLFQATDSVLPGGTVRSWFTSEAAVVVENEGQPPVIDFSNLFHQRTSAGAESFAIPQLDTICAGVVVPENGIALIGGIDFSDGAADPDEAVVVGFDYDDTIGRILSGTARECLRMEAMAGGYTMTYNPFDGIYYALQLDTNALCALEDTGGDACPDVAYPVGLLAARYPELSLGGLFFPEENVVVGSQFGPGMPSHLEDPIAYSWRLPGGDFMPEPAEDYYRNVKVNPAFDGRLELGATYLPIRGTPLAAYELFDGGVSVASGSFSPKGRAVPTLSWAVMSNSELWIDDLDNGRTSVRGFPETPLGSDIRLGFDTGFLSKNKLKLDLTASPDFRAEFELSGDLTDFGANRYGFPGLSRFGRSYAKADLSVLGGVGRGFARGVTSDPGVPPGQPDTFHFIPGVWDYGCVAGNDDALPSARYQLVSTSGIPADAFSFYGDGSFGLSYPTFDSSFSFTYRIRQGSSVSEDITATVLPEGTNLTDPEVGLVHDGITYLEVYGLQIGVGFYPLYQFSLRPPDNCTETHWHSPGRPVVSAIGSAPTASDPAPSSCGYGTLAALPVKTRLIDKTDWTTFRNDHP